MGYRCKRMDGGFALGQFDKKSLSKYDFPVSRIGEINSPKLIILLENQASHPIQLEWNPEYTIWRDGYFINSDADSSADKPREIMDFDTVTKYDKWWFELSMIWKKKNFNNNEILALEYYPYATLKSEKDKEIYKDDWNKDDGLAKRAKAMNLKILRVALEKRIPIFVYYKSGWYNDDYINLKNQNNQDLISHYDKEHCLPFEIRRRFLEFLEMDVVKDMVDEIRKSLQNI